MSKDLARTRVIGFAVVAAMLGAGGALCGEKQLKLRVNDATGVPGGLAAVVVRTYASQAIGQGQLCLDIEWNGDQGYADKAFVSLEGVIAFSEGGDVFSRASFDELDNKQPTIVSFESPSQSINARKGPLLVLFFRLDPNLVPGRKFGIDFGDDQNFLYDEENNSIPLKLVGGKLTIRDPAAAFEVAAQNDRVRAGELAQFGVETFETFGLSSGQFGIRFDASVTSGLATVEFDPRHGSAVFTVQDIAPGLVVVSFVSVNGSFNVIPGEIVTVRVPTLAGVKPGTNASIRIDPDLSFVVDADGTQLAIDFLDGALRFR